jgi:histidinol-phosphate aminotransferase
MAGARLGYLLGPAWVVGELHKVVLPYHLDTVKQLAGLVAVEFVAEMEQRVAAIVEERGRLQAALTDLGAEVWPSGANFVLFRPPDRPAGPPGQVGGADDSSTGKRVWKGLVERSVLVRDTSGWDPPLE